jgi:hypothetical protein
MFYFQMRTFPHSSAAAKEREEERCKPCSGVGSEIGVMIVPRRDLEVMRDGGRSWIWYFETSVRCDSEMYRFVL